MTSPAALGLDIESGKDTKPRKIALVDELSVAAAHGLETETRWFLVEVQILYRSKHYNVAKLSSVAHGLNVSWGLQ